MNDAPITSVLLTVQFAPAILFNPIQITDAFGDLRSEFPVFEQIDRAGPMPINPRQMIISTPFGPLRNLFRTIDNSRSIAFQEDRFSYGWSRTGLLGSPTEYPGFELLLEKAADLVQRLSARLLTGDTQVNPIVGEVLYVNHFRLNESETRVSSIFPFMSPDFKGKITSFAHAWTEALPEGGFIEAQARGPESHAEDGLLAALQLTARFQVINGWDGIRAEFSRAHDAIADVFRRAVNPEFRPI